MYRDLAENWNIDIANELEEYLGELEKITFTFDEGGKTLNFAEGKKRSSTYRLTFRSCIVDSGISVYLQ